MFEGIEEGMNRIHERWLHTLSTMIRVKQIDYLEELGELIDIITEM